MTEIQTPTNVTPVLPPVGACCANDLWDIELPADVEAANYNTHCFDWMEGRCGNCDCRSGGQWSRFACADNSVVKATAITFEDFQASLAR